MHTTTMPTTQDDATSVRRITFCVSLTCDEKLLQRLESLIWRMLILTFALTRLRL